MILIGAAFQEAAPVYFAACPSVVGYAMIGATYTRGGIVP